MELVAEFVANGYQYQTVSNGSWSMPMSGCRRRPLDEKGNAIGEWEVISFDEYERAEGK